MHDILFAPFFTGAAGAGMSWHWESYVHKNNLWYHFGRFQEAIKGVDPVRESFVPVFDETDKLRIYTLKGKHTSLIWVRDKNNNWETELESGLSPSTVHGTKINLLHASAKSIDVYDPWTNKWASAKPLNNKIRLPDFKRSLVIRVVY
jgi:hypothetical protein